MNVRNVVNLNTSIRIVMDIRKDIKFPTYSCQDLTFCFKMALISRLIKTASIKANANVVLIKSIYEIPINKSSILLQYLPSS